MINDVKGTQQAALQNVSSRQQAARTENQIHQAQGRAKQSSAGPANDVNLTDTAAKLLQLQAQVANQPIVDTQRVETVKKAIADGSFKIDANKIADKMVEFENLLAAKSGNK